ncbi:MAG: hypothetical protein [Olavius algarvensis Gamma 1 endosymbiont]|nr:MAG: hypothetical protein [Olavius algarvensis Gamma 1 endosymbiont]
MMYQGSSRQSEAVWGDLLLGPRASRPHRVVPWLQEPSLPS